MSLAEVLRAVGPAPGLGGIAVAATIWLLRDIVYRNIFPQLTKQHAYEVIRLIVLCAAGLSVVAIMTWAYVELHKPPPSGDKTTNPRVVVQLPPPGPSQEELEPLKTPVSPTSPGTVFYVPKGWTQTSDEETYTTIKPRPDSQYDRMGISLGFYDTGELDFDSAANNLSPPFSRDKAINALKNGLSPAQQYLFVKNYLGATEVEAEDDDSKITIVSHDNFEVNVRRMPSSDPSDDKQIGIPRIRFHKDGITTERLIIANGPSHNTGQKKFDFSSSFEMSYIDCSAPTSTFIHAEEFCDNFFRRVTLISPTFFDSQGVLSVQY